MNIKNLSDEALLIKTRELVAEERSVTLEILRHLREVERRRLYAGRSYPSLFEYATRELGYSEGAAQRRISSMRLLKELPELEPKIESGALSLSVVAQAQSFFRQEPKSIEEKRVVLLALEGRSRREAERELASRALEPARLAPDRFRSISSELVQIQFMASPKLREQFEELKALLAHAEPGLTLEGAVSKAFELLLNKLRPKAPKISPPPAAEAVVPAGVGTRSTAERAPTSAGRTPTATGRTPTAETKRRVWHRDGGRCTFEYLGRRCGSRHALEYDHIQPWARGGATTAENLRLRCRTHNQYAATQLGLLSKNSTRLPNGSLNSNRR